MPKEDWLQKEIRKLAQVLAKLLRFKYADQHLEIVQEVDETLMDFLKLNAQEMTPENIAQKLIERTGDVEQVKTLSDIFKEKGLAQERLGEAIGALESFRVALLLAEWADAEESIFSFERMENLDYLRSKI